MHPGDPATKADIEGFLEPFRAVERRDPRWGAAHLVAGIAWVCCLGASNAAEGFSAGILVGIAAVRLPSTGNLYPGLLRTRVMLLFLLVLAWRALSVAWTDNPAIGWGAGISRFVLVPLAFWPLSHRFGALAVAGIVAGSIISAALVGLNVSVDGVARYVDARTLGKEIGMTAACLVAALLLAALLPWTRRAGPAFGRVAAATAIAAGLSVLSQRSAFLAAGGGLLAGFTLAIPRVAARHRRPALLGLAAAVVAVAVVGSLNPRMVAWVAAVRSTVASGEMSRQDWHNLTALRGPLAEIALEMARDRPALGYGMGGFEAECRRRCEQKLKEGGDDAKPFQYLPGLLTSHNFLLDELSMRGGVGLALIVALVALLARRCVQDPQSTACAGVLAAWLVYGFADATTGRGTFVALLALIVTRCAWVEASRAPNGRRVAAR